MLVLKIWIQLVSTLDKKGDFLMILFIHETHTHTERQRHRQREKQAPCRKPHVGLNPRTPGSHPEQKADTQPLSHPGILKFLKFIETFSVALHVIYP